MKTTLLGIALFALTLGLVVYYPQLKANDVQNNPMTKITAVSDQHPKVDVVFVLDTTGSMSGLIQTAKDKIWSIASTMASAQPTPDIRIGLVAYRDQGDQYVTKIVDLSEDLDSVYASLMDFEANGGGDGPESVNRALRDAVHHISWSGEKDAYQVIFLVGDAPPHMDYNELQYPEIAASARQKGIVINTIQCGTVEATTAPWNAIARIGDGNYFRVEQAGSAVAYATPFDGQIAELSARLDETRLYYGSEDEKRRMHEKVEATDKLHASASIASRARRGVFNAAEGGRYNFLGDQELVSAVTSGEVSLEKLDQDALPEAMKPMAPSEQEAYVADLAEKRSELQRQIRKLADDRDAYLEEKVSEAGGAKDSLDQKLFETVKQQAGKAGLEYRDGPAY